MVYAPHMSLIRQVVGGGELDVTHIMRPDQTITSHAKFAAFPWLPVKSVYLSVSGTYGSVNDRVCFVEWNKTWTRTVQHSDDASSGSDGCEDGPYDTIEDVPESIDKAVINAIGKVLFIRPFSVFPVSFLDSNLTVFDFELLGTRICACKQ